MAGDVSIHGKSKVVAKKGGSVISLENDFYNNAGIVMENGSDRASNRPFNDDPQNGVAEAIASSIAAAIQAAVGAIAAAVQGAIGKIGDCLAGGAENQKGNVECEASSSKSDKTSFLDSAINFLTGAQRCEAAERENCVDNNKGELNTELNIDLRNTLNKPWNDESLKSSYDAYMDRNTKFNIDLRDTLNKPWSNLSMDGTNIKSGYDIYMEKTYSNYREKNPDAPDSAIYAQIALRAPWEYKIDAIGNYLSNYNVVTSFPKKFGLMEKQIFVNSSINNGFDPEETEFYGNMVEFYSGNMVFETGFTIAGAGIKSASALKSGEALSQERTIAGSGVGNLASTTKVSGINKAKNIANQVKNNGGKAPNGYKGGRTFKNIPLQPGAQKLPTGVNYREYDINPYIRGQNRGAERIVIGDNGSVWYTNDHYYTFTQIK